MEQRAFGHTGLKLSMLGVGCGAVGGLMVRGAVAEQERAIGRALDAGVNYFDTAVQYGDGKSEENLGRILGALKPADAIVGTKVRLPSRDFGRIAAAVRDSLDGSLRRLKRERVDILHLHNEITANSVGESLGVRQVLEDVVPAFEVLRQQGKLRFIGLTAVGDTASLRQALDSCKFQSAQIVYNLLNPSAGRALPAHYPAQDYGQIFERTGVTGTGVVGVRILAGGALSGTAERHKIASPAPAPIGSANSYDGDLARAGRFMPLLRDGFAATLAEAAIRFAIAHKEMGTILVGMATPEQFEEALAAVEKGPLPKQALDRIASLQQGFAGEKR